MDNSRFTSTKSLNGSCWCSLLPGTLLSCFIVTMCCSAQLRNYDLRTTNSIAWAEIAVNNCTLCYVLFDGDRVPAYRLKEKHRARLQRMRIRHKGLLVRTVCKR